MSRFWAIVEWLPVGSYPIQQSFRHRTAVLIVSLACVLTFSGLVGWNVGTQGRDLIFTPVFLEQFTTNRTTSCQPTRVNVGDTVFMYPFGNFSWVLNGVDRGQGFETGFSYTGGTLKDVRVTSVGLTYEFNAQNFIYGVCANASIQSSAIVDGPAPRVEALPASLDNTVLSFCTNYDLVVANLPHWTDGAKNRLQLQIYGIANFWQNLTFPNGTFPPLLIPPYGQPGGPSAADTSVIPASINFFNIWLLGFAYLPVANPNKTALFGNDHTILVGNQTLTLNQTFDEAVVFAGPEGSGLGGGIGITVNGIGNIHLNTNKTNENIGFKEPEVISKLRAFSVNVVNLLMDMAVQDVDGVPIAESYLCTVTSTRWKGPLAMIAMVLGNSAGVFGVAFAFMLTVARWFDERSRAKEAREQITVAQLESAAARNSTEKIRGDESIGDGSSTGDPLSPTSSIEEEPAVPSTLK